MTRTHKHRGMALALALSLSASGCAQEVSFEPPVDPESIQLGKAATAQDVSAFTLLFRWVEAQAMSLLYDAPWTNWYKDSKTVGLVKLAVMRTIMNEENLFHSYPANVRTGYASIFLTCPSSTQTARTADGRCNDRDDKLMGAAGTRFGHTVPLDSVRPET
ncbi:MAG: hypothetical protein H5U40_09705, partial [Polyangiaceae bacterium]|nr:hypothetical protein [Polyangiaceae bacterium]